MMKKKPTLLVVNDDGVFGPGLRPLISQLKKVGNVVVVVPDQERSADSHCLTLHKPLRVKTVDRDFYILNGSPADCARFGVLGILKDKVDLVVSGINHGFNLGEDVIYSGTVAAALEATLLDKQAFAISQGGGADLGYAGAADFARKLAGQVLRRGLTRGICLNVNVPNLPKSRLRGASVCTLGQRIYDKKITGRKDPRGMKYFWLAGKNVSGVAVPGSDVEAIYDNRVSVTPLHTDITDIPTIHQLKKWSL